MSPKPSGRKRSGNGDARRKDTPSPITVLRELKGGELSATSLDVESRRACVEHLAAEGYTSSEVAEVLKISPRTVFRDLTEIRRANAIEVTPEKVHEFIGDLVLQANRAVARMRRVTRERDCPHGVRVDAERSAWVVARELTETLQRLGFLPTAAQEIRADLTHRVDASPTLEELQSQADALERVLLETDSNEATKTQLASIKDDLSRQRAGEDLRALSDAVQTGNDEPASVGEETAE